MATGHWVWLSDEEYRRLKPQFKWGGGVIPSDLREILSDLIELVDKVNGQTTGKTASERRAWFAEQLEEQTVMLRLDPHVQQAADLRNERNQKKPQF